MATTTFIKGYKVNLHVGFNCATVEIYEIDLQKSRDVL